MNYLRRWQYPKRRGVRHRASVGVASRSKIHRPWWKAFRFLVSARAAVILFALAATLAKLDAPLLVIGAVAAQGAATMNDANPTTTTTWTIPSAVVATDVLTLEVSQRNAAGLPTVTDDDTGGNTWTHRTDLCSADDSTHHFYFKLATSGTASKTVTLSGTAGVTCGVLNAYSGADQFNPIYTGSVEENVSANETHAGFTPPNPDSMVCLAVLNINTTSAVTSPSTTNPGALTIRAEDASTGGGFNTATMHASALQSGAAGATGNFTWAQTDAASRSIVYAISPAQIISLVSAGTWATLTADGAVTIPSGAASGDRMYLWASWKAFSITASVTDWTAVGSEFADGTTIVGNGTGSMKVQAWYKDHDGSESNPTLDFSSSPDVAGAVIQVWRLAAGYTWDAPAIANAAIASADPITATASTDPGITAGDLVIGLIGIRDDSATFTRDPATGLAATGVTWGGAVVESPAAHLSTTTGNDMAADLVYRKAYSGTGSAAPTMTADLSAAETGAALFVRQRVTAAGGGAIQPPRTMHQARMRRAS